MNLSILQNNIVSDGASAHPMAAARRESPLAQQYKVIHRNGAVVPFNDEKIKVALTKAFRAVRGTAMVNSAGIRDAIDDIVLRVIDALILHNQHIRPLLPIAHAGGACVLFNGEKIRHLTHQ